MYKKLVANLEQQVADVFQRDSSQCEDFASPLNFGQLAINSNGPSCELSDKDKSMLMERGSLGYFPPESQRQKMSVKSNHQVLDQLVSLDKARRSDKNIHNGNLNYYE